MRRILTALLTLPLAFAASAKMVHRPVDWTDGGTRFHSVLVYDDTGAANARRPGLVMVPNWYGVNEQAVAKAEMIAGKQYVILLTDMYGRDVRPTNDTQAKAAVKPLYGDRALMRRRVNLALAQLKAQAGNAPLDTTRLAAIGFCFGGSAVLDLARSGADIAAVVSFHGALAAGHPALPDHIKTRVLAMNGADDKSTMPDAGAFMDEMRASGADWQFVALGDAVHCFTEVGENAPGCRYDARAAARSYRMMHDWLDAAFAGRP